MTKTIDEGKILGIIADIQTGQQAVERYALELKEAKQAVEEAEESLADEQSNVQGLRDELEAYLDEIIPDGNEFDRPRVYQF